MEIDFSSVWSWTLPLWALVAIVAFLGGILTQPVRIVPFSMRSALNTIPVASAPPVYPENIMPPQIIHVKK